MTAGRPPVPEHPRVRFAPSPTGSLHVGGARTALFNWLLARSRGGTFVLRIEDTDTARNQAESEAAIVGDLRWLGLAHDEGPDTGGRYGPYRQSERAGLHAEYAQRLLASGAAYEDDGAVRFRIPPGHTTVEDLIKGPVTFAHVELKDPVILKSDGGAAYNFAAAVDDALMEIDVVLRADEHLPNTPLQLLMQAAAGLRSPHYAHVGLVLDADRHKLSKRHHTVGLDQYRKLGVLPAAMLNHLALLGWHPPEEREDLTLDDLVRLFTLDRVGASGAVFDEGRLFAFNARELRRLPRDEYARMLAAAMRRERLLEADPPEAAWRWIDTFLDAYGGEVHTIAEAIRYVEELRALETSVPALELERLRNRQVLFFLDAVSQYVDSQPELRGLPLSHDLPAIATEFGIKKKDAYHAVRMALTGRGDGAPLTLLFPLLGHDRIMARIGAINSHVLHGRGLEPIPYGPGGTPFETIQPLPPPAGADGTDPSTAGS